MSDEVLVRVDGVAKKFCRTLKRSLLYGVQDVAGELLGREGGAESLRPGEFWSVRDVSFELRRGECLGLIGPNGAGKSTLLKMLNGLVKPDRGRITMRGRVAALIELGAGFNPVLTGRENIYVNGSVLGLSKREIARRFDEIVEFSELGDFIDMPVQNYSSGMKVRLGFAIAAQLEPDVLLIDEVLAVGDMGFRAKCYNAIANLAERTAVIFVSHSMTHVGRICTKSLVIDRGQTSFYGEVPSALLEYNKLFLKDVGPFERAGNQLVRFESVEVVGHKESAEVQFQVGSKFGLKLIVKSDISVDSLVIDLAFINLSSEIVAQCNNFVYPYRISIAAGDDLCLKLEVPALTINPGVYKISLVAQSENMSIVYDWMDKFETITIVGRAASATQQFRGKWHIQS